MMRIKTRKRLWNSYILSYDALAILEYVKEKYMIEGNLKVHGEGHAGVIGKLVSMIIETEGANIECDIIPYTNLFRMDAADSNPVKYEDFDVRKLSMSMQTSSLEY